MDVDGHGTVVFQTGDRDGQELVDAVAAAVDTDRWSEVERVRAALEPFGLAGDFADELRLFGVGSNTWGRCEFCGDVVAEMDADAEVAA
ncbi:MAG: hypothetical protein AAGA93_00620 [Actinomycetota bacterium]